MSSPTVYLVFCLFGMETSPGAFRVPGSPARGGAFRGSPEARGEPERDRGSERRGDRGHRGLQLGGG